MKKWNNAEIMYSSFKAYYVTELFSKMCKLMTFKFSFIENIDIPAAKNLQISHDKFFRVILLSSTGYRPCDHFDSLRGFLGPSYKEVGSPPRKATPPEGSEHSPTL